MAPLRTTNTGLFVRITVAQGGGGWFSVGGTWWQLGLVSWCHASNLCFLHVPRDADDGDDAQLHHEKHTI